VAACRCGKRYNINSAICTGYSSLLEWNDNTGISINNKIHIFIKLCHEDFTFNNLQFIHYFNNIDYILRSECADPAALPGILCPSPQRIQKALFRHANRSRPVFPLLNIQTGTTVRLLFVFVETNCGVRRCSGGREKFMWGVTTVTSGFLMDVCPYFSWFNLIFPMERTWHPECAPLPRRDRTARHTRFWKCTFVN